MERYEDMLRNYTIKYSTFNTGEKEKEKHPPSVSVDKGDDSNSTDDEPLLVIKEKLAAPKKTTDTQQYAITFANERNPYKTWDRKKCWSV